MYQVPRFGSAVALFLAGVYCIGTDISRAVIDASDGSRCQRVHRLRGVAVVALEDVLLAHEMRRPRIRHSKRSFYGGIDTQQIAATATSD
ncbi:hypothetical protein C488_19947 [Natrinema pellirubrum DSM 15624]|uniref:Uncharacterized protein n=1 Tax=Natrinema pellirubrum (strain DSM 15624 / CIP 106293 / JCM 10476 / NCIMB 786 / 157) TaxID=797303 RepID=L9Y6J6_NATP1|nr:hypothetical protein C488_19947 [Natrinema pellirubrum DSM 15624]